MHNSESRLTCFFFSSRRRHTRLPRDWSSDVCSSDLERTLMLEAEVSDAEGLRRIVLEVNGKDAEEVVFQNERPVRKKNGMVARGTMPGKVKGDGQRVVINVP